MQMSSAALPKFRHRKMPLKLLWQFRLGEFRVSEKFWALCHYRIFITATGERVAFYRLAMGWYFSALMIYLHILGCWLVMSFRQYACCSIDRLIRPIYSALGPAFYFQPFTLSSYYAADIGACLPLCSAWLFYFGSDSFIDIYWCLIFFISEVDTGWRYHIRQLMP